MVNPQSDRRLSPLLLGLVSSLAIHGLLLWWLRSAVQSLSPSPAQRPVPIQLMSPPIALEEAPIEAPSGSAPEPSPPSPRPAPPTAIGASEVALAPSPEPVVPLSPEPISPAPPPAPPAPAPPELAPEPPVLDDPAVNSPPLDAPPLLPSDALTPIPTELPPRSAPAPAASPVPSELPGIAIDRQPTPTAYQITLAVIGPLEATQAETFELPYPLTTQQRFTPNPERSACLPTPESTRELGEPLIIAAQISEAGLAIPVGLVPTPPDNIQGSLPIEVGSAYAQLAACFLAEWPFEPAIAAGVPVTSRVLISIQIDLAP